MLNKGAIDRIREQITDLEAIRDILLKDGNGLGNLDPIFEKLNDLYGDLLEELGHPRDTLDQ